MKFLIIVYLILSVVVLQSKAQYPRVNTPEIQSKTQKNPFNPQLNSIQKDTIKRAWDHLTINSDSRINKLMEIKKEEIARKEGNGIDGYRVQIYRGANEEADKLRSRFMSKYPEFKVYKKFQTPDFTVRIGDFRNRSEAIQLKNKIEMDFPNAFIVEDVINFPKLTVVEK